LPALSIARTRYRTVPDEAATTFAAGVASDVETFAHVVPLFVLT
jgi:hypothetical protein